MRTGMRSMFRELCRWEVGVRLRWLPMTRRHLDWVRLSLQQPSYSAEKRDSYSGDKAAVGWNSSLTSILDSEFVNLYLHPHTYIFMACLFINTSKPRVYSTLFRLWPVEDFAQLENWPTGSHEVARVGCIFTWNYSVTRSTVLTEADRRH